MNQNESGPWGKGVEKRGTTHGLAPPHAALRHKVAVALRKARGAHSQPAFSRLLEPYIGRVFDLSQWSKYEQARVDPPAYLVVAAAQASGIPLSELLGQPDRLATMTTLVEELADVTMQLNQVLVQLLAARKQNESTGS